MEYETDVETMRNILYHNSKIYRKKGIKISGKEFETREKR